MNIKAIVIALVIALAGVAGWYVISQQSADEPAVAEAPVAEAPATEAAAETVAAPAEDAAPPAEATATDAAAAPATAEQQPAAEPAPATDAAATTEEQPAVEATTADTEAAAEPAPATAEAATAEAAPAEEQPAVEATAPEAAAATTEDTATTEATATAAEPATTEAAAEAAPADAAAAVTPQIVEMVEGSADATVEVIEYASFTCPHCAHFMQEQYVDIKANYIDTGKVRWVYRDVYFDRFGLWASMIARCGGPLRFFGIADIIYKTQGEWTAGGDPTLIAQNLRNIGKVAGLDDAALDQCMNDADMAQALVDWYTANAERDNIHATPSFLINGEPYSNMSYEDFAKVLDEKLAE